MGGRGFSTAGLARLHEAMTSHVNAGTVPGVVVALARGGDVHVEGIGNATVDGREPMRPDALFRITSMTRPVTAVATLLLVQDGRLSFDEPVVRLLPELADRRVLRRVDGPVEDTVAAHRPITVRDLLTFRAGFGMILAPPDDYPILLAEAALELRSVGPPTPVTPHEPDEWMRRMATLPLMDQPGEQWRYNTGSQILGVLVARASGQTVDSFYKERILEPLGMKDTTFHVPASDLQRLVPCYQQVDGRLEPFDDDNQWTRPRAFTDCGAGLVATAGDYLAFGQMLLAGGVHHDARLLASELVAAMTADQLSRAQRNTAGPILGGRGWGFGLSIMDRLEPGARGPRGYGWSGGFGTVWANDPGADLVAIMCTQVLAAPNESRVATDFWSATYDALER